MWCCVSNHAVNSQCIWINVNRKIPLNKDEKIIWKNSCWNFVFVPSKTSHATFYYVMFFKINTKSSNFRLTRSFWLDWFGNWPNFKLTLKILGMIVCWIKVQTYLSCEIFKKKNLNRLCIPSNITKMMLLRAKHMYICVIIIFYL